MKWPVALGIIGYLINKNRADFENFGSRHIEWHFLLIALVTCLISVVATLVRWYLLVWAQEFPFKFRDALRLGFLGYLFNYIAPGTIGGDVVKAAMLVRLQKNRRLVAASTVIIDRLMGLVSLMVVAAGASLFAPDFDGRARVDKIVWGGTLIGGGLLAVLLHPIASRSRPILWLTRLPKVGHVIGELAEATGLYQSRRLVILLGLLIGVVGQFGVISSFYFCARAISPPTAIPSYMTHILLIPIAELVGVVVPTPGGMGALEAAVQKSYQIAGFEPGLGLMAALGYRLITIVVACIGGIFYVTSRAELNRVMAEDAASQAEATGASA